MSANKIILNKQVLIDLTADTVTENDVASGVTFHKADGTVAVGAKEEKVLIEKEITANDEYSASADGADGYSKITVNVPIPEGYIKPEGSTTITENGEYDIAEYASVIVEVPTGGSGSLVGARKFVDVPAIDKIMPSNDKQFFDLEATVALGNASGIIKKIWIFTTDDTQIISFGYVGDIYFDGELMEEDLELPIYNLWNTTDGGDAWLYEEIAADTGMEVTKDVLQAINITKQPADEIIASFLRVNTMGVCPYDHIIEVEELPETGEEGAIYGVTVPFSDVIASFYGMVIRISENEGEVGFYYVSTKPTTDIKISGTNLYVYYVEDENDIFIYGDLAGTGTNSWQTFAEAMRIELTFGGFITDESQVQDNYYYAVGGNVKYYQFVDNTWFERVIVSGTLDVTANGSYNVKYFENVNVNTLGKTFPSDNWTEGSASAIVGGESVNFTYYYYTSDGDPKEIPFVKEVYNSRSSETLTSSNLADFYMYTLLASTSHMSGGGGEGMYKFTVFELTSEEKSVVQSCDIFIKHIDDHGTDNTHQSAINIVAADNYSGRRVAAYKSYWVFDYVNVQWYYSDSDGFKVTMCTSLPHTVSQYSTNGTYDAINTAKVTVSIPTYIVSFTEGTLPTDATNDTVAFVLGGEYND